MRLQRKTMLAGAVCLLLWACNEHQSHNGDAQHDKHPQQSQIMESEKPQLDNGEKWKANNAMTVHIRAMQNDVIKFKTAEDKDYATLAKQLNTGVNQVISNCTMKGKSHEELHKWLLPYRELVQKLDTSESIESKERTLSAIEAALTEFDIYFE